MYIPYGRQLQAGLYSIEDTDLMQRVQTAFYKLGSGIHPTAQEIIQLKPAFSKAPFSLKSLYSLHVVCDKQVG